MVEFKKFKIKEIKDSLKNKDYSCEELINVFIKRIKNLDKTVRAFITVTEEEALSSAKKTDKRIANGEEMGALEGVPGSIKDVLATEGILTTAASNILKDYKAPYDATAVKNLKDNHFVLLGKNNCDSFAHGSSTENSDFFPTHNPWDLTRTPGGSSGGSAAAVSAGMSVFSLGTDTGGSVRYPAHFCGVVGLKPSYGRVSRYGLLSMNSSTDCPSILTNSVEDTAYVLKAVAGKDEKDATSRNIEVPDYPELLKTSNLKGKKIGIPKEYFGEGLNEGVRKAVEIALSKMKELGAEIVDVSLPHTKYAVPVYYVLMPSEVSSNLARYDGIKYGYSALLDKESKNLPNDLYEVYTKSRAHGFGEETKRRILIGTYALSAGYFDAYYKKATQVRHLIADDFRKAFEKVDIIATPTGPHCAFKIGEKVNDPLALYLEDVYMAAVSLAGLPGISVPCGFSTPADDANIELPVGLQLIGKYFDENSILQVAYTYEQSTAWRERFPICE